MPIRGERQRKIRILQKGGSVRAPKRFWNKMFRQITKEYPNRNKEDRSAIVGGIWRDYSTQTKIEIIKEYQ